MGIIYRNPFAAEPHLAQKRKTTRDDGFAPNSIGFSINQTWGALKRCWRAFRIAKKDGDWENMQKYAKRIRKLQYELDVTISEFPDIGIIGSDPHDVDLMCC